MGNFAEIADVLSYSLQNITTLEHLMYLITGVLLGLSIGIFPGLGGIAGLSMMLPFLYGMDLVSGLALMVGLVAVIPTSDTFASVLMGIPGSSSSQATVLDGFPLAKRGEAARALSAAFASSLFGGLIGALLLTVLVLVARPIIINFRTPELLMITIFGFSMVGAISGKSMAKGMLAVAVGVLFSVIGEAPAYGTQRLSYDNWYLRDGLQLVTVGLGIFAMPEIIDLLRGDRSIAGDTKLGKGWRTGLLDWWQNKWLSVRNACIGVVVGIIPGLGGSVVDWIAYGHTVQSTKDKSQFGKGEIRGIIGPESSNNAKEGGGLIPTLLFGIPGSGSMAVFLGGMILLGVEAGPSLVDTDLDITYSIVWSLAIANVFGAGLCIFLSGPISRLTKIPFPLLAPFLFLMVSFASFQAKQTIWDLVMLLLVTVLGVYMKRFGWSRPAFLIGFVLADQAEVYAYQAFQFSQRLGIGYVLTPTVGVIFVLTVISLWLSHRQFKQQHQPKKQDRAGLQKELNAVRSTRRPQIAFTALLTTFVFFTLIETIRIKVLIDSIFPMVIAGAGTLFGLYLLWGQYRGTAGSLYDEDTDQSEEKSDKLYSVLQTIAWFLLLLGLTALAGFLIALSIFFPVYLHFRAKTRPIFTLGLSMAGCIFIVCMAWLLNRDLPPGLLQSLLELPWPLR